MDFIDEIEFFGFVPIAYISSLSEKTINTLETSIPNQDLKRELISNFTKNLQIFEIYALKNIFKFPNSFSFERKVTDLFCNSDIPNIVQEYLTLLDEELYLKNEVFNLEEDLDVKSQILNEYLLLLKDEDSINSLVNKIGELKNSFVETEESFKVLLKQTKSVMHKEQVTEYKLLKNAIWNKERTSLLECAPLELLVYFNEKI